MRQVVLEDCLLLLGKAQKNKQGADYWVIDMLVKFLKCEACREDIPVLSNVDFVHRTPMTVVPMGAMAEIDCSRAAFRIMEPGVVE